MRDRFAWVRFGVFAFVFVFIAPRPARAWLFEEHAKIERAALVELGGRVGGASYRAQIDAVWAVAVREGNGRLCASAFRDPSSPRSPSDGCIDLGMLAAVAGDHACSPMDVWSVVTQTTWIGAVIQLAAQTERDLAAAKSHAAHLDIWHASHIDLRHYDRAYLSRAEHNNAHFLLSRPPRASTLDDYLRVATETDAPVNASMAYLVFHLAAMAQAARLAALSPGSDAHTTALLEALMAEQFAVHFLEDGFSAGHVVGTGGDASERMGTHDYYSEHGVDARTWDGGAAYTAHGDSFLADADVVRASAVVTASLVEFVDALNGQVDDAAEFAPYATLDICAPAKVDAMQSALLARVIGSRRVASVLLGTLVPASAEAGPPRFKNEVGAFFHVAAGPRGALDFAGPGASNAAPRPEFGVQFSAGVGGAFSGLATSSTDGLLFAQLDLLGRSGQPEIFCGSRCPPDNIREYERFEYGGTVRMPFWLVPGDLLLLSPFYATDWYQDLAIRAAQGGVLGRWERVRHAVYGAWQILLGREVGLRRTEHYFYVAGSSGGATPAQTSTARPGFVLELPVMEFRTTRLYSGDLGGGLTMQPGVAWESNRAGDSVVVYLKVLFDGRYYFARP